jgi:hypothetical protein
MGPKGRARSRKAVSRDLDRWIGSGCFRSSAQGANSTAAGAAPSAVVKPPELMQAEPPGSLGSPGLVGTGEEGPVNTLAGLQPRERDQRRENARGCSGWVGMTPAMNPDHGEGE